MIHKYSLLRYGYLVLFRFNAPTTNGATLPYVEVTTTANTLEYHLPSSEKETVLFGK